MSFSESLWNDLVDPVFEGVGLAGFKSRFNTFLLAYPAGPIFVVGISSDKVYIGRSHPCIADLLSVIINIKNNRLIFYGLRTMHN